jgi:DNA ligase
MPDLEDDEAVEVKGSGTRMYTLRNTAGVYSCSCPAWRNQGVAIEHRTCKHLKKYRSEDAEKERLGANFMPTRAAAGDKDGPPLLLAERWDSAHDLTGWWMSEKLDGVRAYWDGKGFVSRLGNPFLAPDWFIEGLPPDVPLDGELWVGRQQFQRTVSVVRRKDRGDAWKTVRFLVFDAPTAAGPFEDRLARVHELLGDALPHAEMVAHEPCEGLEHMQRRLAEVEAAGGEGLMLREPRSSYEIGRSGTLLKVKTFHDAEAIVVGHVAGKGRHKGNVGALAVELADGTCFSVGTGMSDALRRAPPAVGAVITFRYQELSKAGVPRFPSFVGVRDDLAWQGRQPAAAPATGSADPASTDAPVTSTSRRYFELVGDGSSKFWAIELIGCAHTVSYGRLGTQGQSRTKEHADEASAQRSAGKLIDTKVAKGYVEVAE